MRAAEIDVIIDERTASAGIVKKLGHLRTQHGIEREIRTEHHHVIGRDVGKHDVEPLRRIVFVEEVVRLVVLVEESQGHGRLALGKHIDMTRLHAVPAHEVEDGAPDTVVARLADEVHRHAHAPQGNDAIEH